MKATTILLFALTLASLNINAQNAMSDEYYRVWNKNLQDKIDDNIERYRKADAVVVLKDIAPGTDVKVEQVSHKFIFGYNPVLLEDIGARKR